MRHLCCKNRLFILVYILALSIIGVAIFKFLTSFNPKSAVVYYGDKHPSDRLETFDIIILESGNVDTNTEGFKKNREKIFTYVSIGEVEKNRSYYSQIKQEWLGGENKLWKSKLLDLSKEGYKNFLIDSVITDLIKKGYKNFFFDTVDSYHLLPLTEKEKLSYELEIVDFLKKLKTKYPNIKIILNRGFEIIDRAYPYINGVLFESLFYGLDHKTLDYRQVPYKDREWLLAKVKMIQSYKLPVIALDYLPPKEMKKAKVVAKKIHDLNIIPYIGDKYLQAIGVSYR